MRTNRGSHRQLRRERTGFFSTLFGARKDNFSPLGLSGDDRATTLTQLDPRTSGRVELAHALQNYYARTTQACKKGDENRRVFHNSGHIPKGNLRSDSNGNSHLELESLPTGGWGYDHFPLIGQIRAPQRATKFLGMTGKFHTTWGEFGGFQTRQCFPKYECAAMLAFGAKCSIGDQLHPDGAMNQDTYDLIGAGLRPRRGARGNGART